MARICAGRGSRKCRGVASASDRAAFFLVLFAPPGRKVMLLSPLRPERKELLVEAAWPTRGGSFLSN